MVNRGGDRDNLPRRRIKFAFLCVLACYLSLVGRLLYLQGIHGAELHRKAIRNRLQPIKLSALRGTIYGRDDQPLSASLYSGTAGFDPFAVQTGPGSPQAAAKVQEQLANSVTRMAALLHVPLSTLQAIVSRACAEYPRLKKRFYPIKRGLNLEQATLLREAKPRLLGFGVSDGVERLYSSGSSTAQVIGFLDAGGVGMAGLERGCGKWLTGKDGKVIAEVDNRKHEIPGSATERHSAVNGLDVHTTLDANAQHIATDEAQQIVAKFHPEGVSVVIVEPDTGDIRALVSLPNFDANPDPTHPGRRPPISASALRERCVGGVYEPGSTLKTLTIAAALDSGVISEANTYYCSGEYRIGKRSIHCAHGEVHHTVTPQDILRESCNIGAAQIGLQMGGPQLYKAVERFGLFDKFDLGLPVQRAGRWSEDTRAAEFSAAKTARVAFGHSITTTPLHVAMAYAAIANGGVLVRPRLLTSLTDDHGRVVKKWEPQAARRVISAQTSATMMRMLRTVVTDGTARVTAMPGYQVAGKTGTASKYKRDAYVGSFIGMIPAGINTKPRAVILVTVDTPDTSKGYYGADVAAPYFKAIARRLMDCWRVPEDDPNGTQALAAINSLRRKEHLPPLASLTDAQHTTL
jgi:stage V sporulation protein D (sporulation-specific penicillin-binding protein)